MSEEEKQVAEAIPAAAEEKTVERDLVINSHASEVDIALLEDNILVELHREKTNNQFAVGDVYLGRVKKLLPGLNAAFVEVGYPKEAFLHYLDLGLQAHSMLKYKKRVVAGEDIQGPGPVDLRDGAPVPVKEQGAGLQLHQKGAVIQEGDSHGGFPLSSQFSGCPRKSQRIPFPFPA